MLTLFSALCLSCRCYWVTTRSKGACLFCGAYNVLYRDHDEAARREIREELVA